MVIHVVTVRNASLVEAPAVSSFRTVLVLRVGISGIAVMNACIYSFPHQANISVAPNSSSVVSAQDLDFFLSQSSRFSTTDAFSCIERV